MDLGPCHPCEKAQRNHWLLAMALLGLHSGSQLESGLVSLYLYISLESYVSLESYISITLQF